MTSNQLADATSPYLLKHADNPVDWFPWGAEAFEEAERRGVPVFLSVGYSSCHWCHVMARESFADPDMSELINERFVSIKVDREERPDIDALYMRAVESMGGSGGWPMSVFLTAKGEPFFAGSYWPPEPHAGTPSFEQVLVAVSTAWTQRPAEVRASVEALSASVSSGTAVAQSTGVDHTVVGAAAEGVLGTAWDRQHGGFGKAPKFPHAMVVEWLLHRYARTGDPLALEASVQALESMKRGGIHDQLDGGFARYTLDREWLVPHFEKMLYDNALLLPTYAAAATLAGNEELEHAARATATYLLDELRAHEGVFASASDADSADGVEGGFYTWTHDELLDSLSEVCRDPATWVRFLGATPEGNWAGTNVLHESVPHGLAAQQLDLTFVEFSAEWNRIRAHLSAGRALRPPPHVDGKVLADWNALAARGLVRAGVLLDEPSWVEAGGKTVDFLHGHLFTDDHLQHVWMDRRATVDALLLDHAALALADIELFQATGESRFFRRALTLASATHDRFHDEASGGWFQGSNDSPHLYHRLKDVRDETTPSGTAVMVEVCLVLAGLTGDLLWRYRAEEGLQTLQDGARTHPMRYGWALRQLEALATGQTEVAVIGAEGPDRDELVRTVVRRPRPGVVMVVARPDHDGDVPLLVGRGDADGSPAAYVCRDSTCSRPVTSPVELESLLDRPPQRSPAATYQSQNEEKNV